MAPSKLAAARHGRNPGNPVAPAGGVGRSAATSARNLRVVLSTAPARAAASIARHLVASRVAACVNIVPGVRSVYRWRGKIENTQEHLLIVKTTARALPRCLEALADKHPYEVPEGLVLAPDRALSAYGRWVREFSR
jgi:periplasmic divalent cation tolerance protein